LWLWWWLWWWWWLRVTCAECPGAVVLTQYRLRLRAHHDRCRAVTDSVLPHNRYSVPCASHHSRAIWRSGMLFFNPDSNATKWCVTLCGSSFSYTAACCKPSPQYLAILGPQPPPPPLLLLLALLLPPLPLQPPRTRVMLRAVHVVLATPLAYACLLILSATAQLRLPAAYWTFTTRTSLSSHLA
jgi:hypothetical protein